MGSRGALHGRVAVQVPVSGSYSSAESDRRGRRRRRPPATSTLPSGSRTAAWRSCRWWSSSPWRSRSRCRGRTARSRSRPVTSTLPSRSNVADARRPLMTIFPVAVQVPLAGSYTSAPMIRGRRASGSSTSPTSTLPSRSNVAGKPRVGLEHVPGGGPGPGGRVVQLRGGVVLIAVGAAHDEHPAIEEPHGVWPERGVPIDPVAIQTPAGGVAATAGGGETPAGMYSSAEPSPPATRTVPSSSNVAEPLVGMTIFSVTVQVPLSGSYSSAPSTSPTSTLPSSSNVAGKPAWGLSMLPVADQVPVAGSYNSAEVSF